MRATLSLLLLALVAAGVFLFLGSTGDGPPTYEDTDVIDTRPPRETPDTVPDEPETPAVVAAGPAGVPRILPPDAAIEDVRDALTLEDTAARAEALRAAGGALGRIAQTPRVLQGLQKYVRTVSDPRVRAVVYAALGANTSGIARAWLAEQLQRETTPAARLGALLGLAHDAEASERTAEVLGGLPYRAGALPARLDVREALGEALAAFAEEAGQAAARDALPVLRETVRRHPTWFEDQAARIDALARTVGG